MTDPALHPLELILHQCQAAAPNPWYPSAHARQTGVSRDVLDPHLDRLRLGGLIHLTDWVQGLGQGYSLTPAGRELLASPRQLASLRQGRLPVVRASNPEPESREPANAWDRGERIRDALLGPAVPWVTLSILFANLVMFLVGLLFSMRAGVPVNRYLSGTNDVRLPVVMHELGAVKQGDFVPGKASQPWWRLLACTFLHFGLLHLGTNMYSLFAVGPLLEKIWGHGRFLLLYLIAGIGGSCAMVLWLNRGSVGAGASGALWGIIATLAVWVSLNRRYLPPSLASDWMRQLFIVFVLNVGVSFMPGISASAHFGGGIVGALAAIPMNLHRYGGRSQRLPALLAALAIPGLAVADLQKNWTGQLDLVEMEHRVLPRFNACEMLVLETSRTTIAPLLRQPPEDRDNEAVDAAVRKTAEVRRELQAMQTVLESAGPYRNDIAETARGRLWEVVDLQEKLLAAVDVRLEKGVDWTEADRAAFHEQENNLKEAYKRWKEVTE